MGSARDHILTALENLTSDEFKKFKTKLLSCPLREGFGRIPRGPLMNMDVIDLTDKIVTTYMENYGLELTTAILRDINQAEAAALQKAAGAAAPRVGPSKIALGEAEQQHFMDKHRQALINRVTSVDALLDALYGKVLSEQQYQEVRAEKPSANQMRKLFSFSVAWNRSCKDQLFQALKATHPFLVSDLENS
ncbi:apoptosis-associated speck-like protein containing a CARD [Ornithorhynchus anatinus]|uniref:Apoptosis-associated speck-like protein containing a CARD n=1 Tax=Ornithorhynchus anatinus TaxID=9258 RepID=F7DDL2_ORNAN|nr:apoptosis-associated speck-like protein containing a CARD [Ornithorhynchus anatinus]